MFKERGLPIILFCVIVIIVTAVMQFQNPSTSLFDGGFILVVLLTIFLSEDSFTRIFGITGLTLLLISVFYPQDDYTFKQVLLQRLFSSAILLMTMFLVLYLKKLYRTIEMEENQMNALFEYATEAIVLTNARGEIVLVNPEALRLFQYEKEELIGKRIDILIPQRYHPNHEGYRKGFMDKPTNRKMGHNRELFAARKSGDEFPVEVSLSHYKHKDGAYVIAFIIDITQRKQSEQILLQQKNELIKITEDISKLNTELEYKVEERTIFLKDALNKLEESQTELEASLNKEKELNEIKSRFVSMASHEFRTPLSTILSSSALIGKYQKSEEQEHRNKHTNRIKTAVKHLNDLLEDFLSVGKLEEGRVTIQPELIQVAECVRESEEDIKVFLKPNQQLLVDISGDAVFNTDKRLLKHILLNLMGNAIKFSDAGSLVTVNIMVHEQMKIVVKDQGIGISEEDQQHLFETFFRGKNAFNIQGTGLGLHIVKRYVQLLGGTIDLQSELNRGTTFTIQIPAAIK